MSEVLIWKRFLEIAFDLLLPTCCAGCGKTGNGLCVDCRHQLPHLDGDLCQWCSRPLGKSSICQHCHVRPLAVQIRAPYQFQGVVRQAIHSFKYRNYRSLATPFAELLSDYWQSHTLDGDVLVPVPLHRSKLRFRGYNQSELLADELGKKIGLPVLKAALTRRRNAPPQAQATSAAERWANTSGAFECSSPTLRDKRVVLIDDVCTTGATLDTAARCIISSGANSVLGLTIAREV